MGIMIADNFQYRSRKYLDGRQGFATIQEMREFPLSSLPNGMITFVEETGRRYEYHLQNEYDDVYGKWKEYRIDAGSCNGTEVEHHVGDTAPEMEDAVWFDTSNFIAENEESALIIELRNIVKALSDKIDGYEKTIVEHEKRIVFLEMNCGGGTEPPIDPPIDPDPPTTDGFILLENGELLLLEDGEGVLLEGKVEVTNNLLLENGEYLLLENGEVILIETNVEVVDNLLLENGESLLLENGEMILLETKEVISVNNMLLENGNDALLENNEIILLER